MVKPVFVAYRGKMGNKIIFDNIVLSIDNLLIRNEHDIKEIEKFIELKTSLINVKIINFRRME